MPRCIPAKYLISNSDWGDRAIARVYENAALEGRVRDVPDRGIRNTSRHKDYT